MTSNKFDKLDIREWLAYVFQGEEVPEYDESEELMATLKELMLKNKEAEKDATEIMKQEKKYTEIYKKNADDLKTILDAGPLELDSESVDLVEKIAAVAQKLHLNEPTITNFMLAVQEAENKEMETKEKEMLEDYRLACLSKKVTRVMKTNELIRRDLVLLESTVAQQEVNNPELLTNNSFLDKKVKEYERILQKYKMNLKKRDFDSSLEHNQLIKRAEEVDELEKEVNKLHDKINSYLSLPPNQSLAELKVETARNELKALEEKFESLVES